MSGGRQRKKRWPPDRESTGGHRTGPPKSYGRELGSSREAGRAAALSGIPSGGAEVNVSSTCRPFAAGRLLERGSDGERANR